MDEEKKRSVFLTIIGPEAYKLLRSLLAPDKPGKKTFKSLTEIMTKQYNPAPSERVQRYKFNTWLHQPTESVAVYVSELHSLAEHCNYGVILNEMLCDQLVCSINDDAIQCCSLSEEGLTFVKAQTIA